MTIFFTSDTHFSHKLMMKLRGFNTLEEHDEKIINNWNSLVGIKDSVYHLGDFSFCKTKEESQKIFNRLNGKIYLVRGNHDKDNALPDGFRWIKDVYQYYYGKGKFIWLSHYPHRAWPKNHYGSPHLYGHVHNNIERVPGIKSFDAGMDSWNLNVISLETVLETFKTLEIQ